MYFTVKIRSEGVKDKRRDWGIKVIVKKGGHKTNSIYNYGNLLHGT